MKPADDVLRVVREVIGDGPKELQQPPLRGVPLSTDFAKPDLGYGVTRHFEALLRRQTGAEHAIALSSGTAALYCALKAIGVGEGDEVLCPSLTFAATANAICMTGAVPHFIDVHHTTLGIHPFKLRQYLGLGQFTYMDGVWKHITTGRRVAAIVPVHLLGIPCEVPEIRLTCDYYGIPIIEDAAEALGSRDCHGVQCGLAGKAGIISFNLNKIVTTGGGGAVITNDDEIAEKVRRFSTQGKIQHPYRYDHDRVGFNFRMPPMCAALGIDQLFSLPGVLQEKVRLANRYGHAFRDYSSVEHISGGNRWLNAVMLSTGIYGHKWDNDTKVADDGSYEETRDSIIAMLLSAGYGSRAIFTPLHTLPHFNRNPRQPNMAASVDIYRRLVCLPSSIGGERELEKSRKATTQAR